MKWGMGVGERGEGVPRREYGGGDVVRSTVVSIPKADPNT